ncbi:hypothetical protein BDY21DRAFT_293777 [Lineolata rhizophorae]|uniref:Cell wall proline rich protein n=1 Tax=Lineolata rhizophorae TaxID=578093 RepID=A0A6A6NND5_9PEZI|nr:hypothetical protein BDY21DRAFT_293777 [Lineolata rhizophorae]
MAQIALPRHQPAEHEVTVGSPLYHQRTPSAVGHVELLPNPNFVFPMRGPDSPTAAATPPSSGRLVSAQQLSSSKPAPDNVEQKRSASALPNFSFNPATATEAAASASTPPQSPTLPETPTTPSRAMGHRRGGSEFIGGDSRFGTTSAVLSSSPTKSEAPLPTPNQGLRAGPPGGRRGHAHRRSGAISSHDLKVLQPTDPNVGKRGGSAPVTPREAEAKPMFDHIANRSFSNPSLRQSNEESSTGAPAPNPLFPEEPDSSPKRPPSRARVGFSDRVEYIRPLSTISSETESSLSTVRSHSVSNSLSSVISAGAPSPPSARMKPSLNTTLEEDGTVSRPSTAGAVLDMQRRNSDMSAEVKSLKRPRSALMSPTSPNAQDGLNSPTPEPKRKSFFKMEQRKSDPLLPSLLPFSGHSDRSFFSGSPSSSPVMTPTDPESKDKLSSDSSEKHNKSRGKVSKKPRKVKSWADSISRKVGLQGNKPKIQRCPTPPLPSTPPSTSTDDFDLADNFDIDNTVTLISTPQNNARPTLKTDSDTLKSWKPRELSSPDGDSNSPIIDLDAALGPFKTPSLGAPPRAHRGRRMHSSGQLPAHRRAESAPELAPFEGRGTAAASTMADVFEEDEEEAEDEQTPVKKHSPSPSNATDGEDESRVGIEVVESDDKSAGSEMKWDFDQGLGIREEKNANDAEAADTQRSSHEDPFISKEPERAFLPKEPQPQMHLGLPAPPQQQQQPHLQQPQHNMILTPETTFTASSSLSTPDFSPCTSSFDAPRLGTAASSVTTTDNRSTLNSFAMADGPAGPELRVSVDDVPSLTSSRSTWTSGAPGRSTGGGGVSFPSFMPRTPGDRSASLCSFPEELAAAQDAQGRDSVDEQRRRKRSSIASLSRLMGGSGGAERSKLHIEQRPHSEHMEPSGGGGKKAKRLSRLMMFWKGKDGSAK